MTGVPLKTDAADDLLGVPRVVSRGDQQGHEVLRGRRLRHRHAPTIPAARDAADVRADHPRAGYAREAGPTLAHTSGPVARALLATYGHHGGAGGESVSLTVMASCAARAQQPCAAPRIAVRRSAVRCSARAIAAQGSAAAWRRTNAAASAKRVHVRAPGQQMGPRVEIGHGRGDCTMFEHST